MRLSSEFRAAYPEVPGIPYGSRNQFSRFSLRFRKVISKPSASRPM